MRDVGHYLLGILLLALLRRIPNSYEGRRNNNRHINTISFEIDSLSQLQNSSRATRGLVLVLVNMNSRGNTAVGRDT